MESDINMKIENFNQKNKGIQNKVYDTSIASSENKKRINISGDGIKSVLKKYKYEQAIAEFIWNGFDAQAKKLSIKIEESDSLGNLIKISITDDGFGIPRETLEQKFMPFYESHKADEDNRHHSLTHGKNGVGRLTFFTFARKATWTTRYKKDDDIFEYNIEITAQNLEHYTVNNTVPEKSTVKLTGTTVTFEGIEKLTTVHLLGEITDYLRQAFGWFLELFKSNGLSLKINDNDLEYESIIGERDTTRFIHSEKKTIFDVSFIRWNERLYPEYSKFYLINTNDSEIWKDNTKLNNKGDNFYHSVYIKSNFFNNFFYDTENFNQRKLFDNSQNNEEYKFLEAELTNYLRKKRRLFLNEFANRLVQEYEKEGIIPQFKHDWEQPRKSQLEDVIKGLYQIQPKIFNASTIEQKKTFVRFLDALLNSDEREQIFSIISEIVDLDFSEKKELLKLLQSTKLSGIIQTIKLITDRYTTVDQIKQLVFNRELNANERNHIQKMIDKNYWIFGEQYHLVTSTEARFEKALRKYIYLLRGEIISTEIRHIDKNKEMDIFLCRQNKLNNTVENIVVELKSPAIKLGEKEVSQVKKYMNVILSVDQFNGDKTYWDFILVGNNFDSSGYIENELENAKNHGERNNGLIFKHAKYRLYVKKWSDIFTDFECRHKFLEENLKSERNSLALNHESADEIISKQEKNIK